MLVKGFRYWFEYGKLDIKVLCGNFRVSIVVLIMYDGRFV